LVSIIKHLLWLFGDILGLPIRPLQAMVGSWVGIFFVFFSCCEALCNFMF
jgi:hypothetical protein